MQQTVRKYNGLSSIRLNTDKLEDIQKALLKNYRVQVGVLGDKAGRSYTKDKGDEMTNADIGLVHEKGSYSKNIPARSFLEVPLSTHQDEFTKVKKVIKESFEKNTVTLFQAYVFLGIAAEQIIQKAFAQSGPGWDAKKRSTSGTIQGKYSSLSYQKKIKDSRPLIDSGQLRRSISSRVVSNG